MLRESTGMTDFPLELPEGSAVAAAMDAIGARWPRIVSLLHRCAFAVNRAYVPREAILHQGDELAIIPPVSGG